MARTVLATQEITDTGLTPVYSAANVDGHWIDADAYIEVVNGAGAPINVTIQTGGTIDGQPIADRVVAVANGTRKKIGRFGRRAYPQPSGNEAGKIYVDFSSVTTITVGAFRD